MEIYNKNRKFNYKKIKRKLSVKRFTIILFLFIGIVAFAVGNIAYGAYLNKTGQTPLLKNFIYSVKDFDFTFISNYSKSKVTDTDKIIIDINFKNWQKIKYYRER